MRYVFELRRRSDKSFVQGNLNANNFREATMAIHAKYPSHYITVLKEVAGK